MYQREAPVHTGGTVYQVDSVYDCPPRPRTKSPQDTTTPGADRFFSPAAGPVARLTRGDGPIKGLRTCKYDVMHGGCKAETSDWSGRLLPSSSFTLPSCEDLRPFHMATSVPNFRAESRTSSGWCSSGGTQEAGPPFVSRYQPVAALGSCSASPLRAPPSGQGEPPPSC